MTWFATMIEDKKGSRKSVEWAITENCNLRCKHCYMYSNAHKRKPPLSMESINKIATVLRDYAETIVISGGEPFLFKELVDVMKVIAQKAYVVLATNGTIANEEMFKLLKEAGVKAVQLSLDSSSSNFHDKFRGAEGAWEKTIKSLNIAKDLGFSVSVCFTCTSKNYKDFIKYTEKMREMGVGSIYITRFIPFGAGEHSLEYSIENEEEKDFILNYLKPMTEKYPNFIATSMPSWNYYCKIFDKDSVGCSMGHMLFINSCGDAYPCPMVDLKLGNILTDKIDDMFNSESMNNLMSRNQVKGECTDCKSFENCSGCSAWSKYKDNGLFSREKCWIKELI